MILTDIKRPTYATHASIVSNGVLQKKKIFKIRRIVSLINKIINNELKVFKLSYNHKRSLSGNGLNL